MGDGIVDQSLTTGLTGGLTVGTTPGIIVSQSFTPTADNLIAVDIFIVSASATSTVTVSISKGDRTSPHPNLPTLG